LAQVVGACAYSTVAAPQHEHPTAGVGEIVKQDSLVGGDVLPPCCRPAPCAARSSGRLVGGPSEDERLLLSCLLTFNWSLRK